MGAVGKLLAWIFLIGIIGYVVISVMQGSGTDSPTGNIVAVYEDAQDVKRITLPECIDTDDGKNYNALGHTYNKHDKKVYDDYCDGDNTLVEYFCNNEYPDRINIPCECFKGYCI